MTGVLKAPEGQEGHKVAHVQAVGRGIEPAIKGHRTSIEALPQCLAVGAVLHQAPGQQVVKDRSPGYETHRHQYGTCGDRGGRPFPLEVTGHRPTPDTSRVGHRTRMDWCPPPH